MFDALREAIIRAIQAQDRLLSAWQSCRHVKDYSSLTNDDVELLYQLIYRKIYPANAFGALASCNVNRAIEALLNRYLGNAVHPDQGFGGFAYEMGCMLDDLKLSGGDEALRQLISHPRFNHEMLVDVRFRTALREALGLDEDGLLAWLQS